ARSSTIVSCGRSTRAAVTDAASTPSKKDAISPLGVAAPPPPRERSVAAAQSTATTASAPTRRLSVFSLMDHLPPARLRPATPARDPHDPDEDEQERHAHEIAPLEQVAAGVGL